MMDCVAIATGTRVRVPGLPEGMRSVFLADGLSDATDFLKLFGRPKRESACECEMGINLSLAHGLSLVNGPVITGAGTEAANAIVALVDRVWDSCKVVEEIYLRALGGL